MNFLQLAQVLLTAGTVAWSCFLLLRVSRRSSRSVVVNEDTFMAQPVRVKLDPRKHPTKSIWGMRKEELVAECRARNLPVDGTTRVLRAQLRIERDRDSFDALVNQGSGKRPGRSKRTTSSAGATSSQACGPTSCAATA